jgi:amidohydrolase
MESYVVRARRYLHMHPEIGFELEATLAFVRSELEKMGVEYTEEYGKSSIVATVNKEKSNFTIGVRADMDALPITEENDVPYKSKCDGKMHACGHDAHTAIALDVLRRVNEAKEKIDCRVKFVFQAAEEYPPSGAKLMAEDGVMNDIDCIVSLHCDTAYEVGELGLSSGPQNATSDGFYLRFYGKSAHAAQQQRGIDAIMMAHRAYSDIEFMIAKEISSHDHVIFNVGAIHGGVTNNIIPDSCEMFCTLRTQSDDVAEYALNKIKKIISSVAECAGGRAEFVQNKHYPIVKNNEVLTARMRVALEKTVGYEKVLPKIQSMGGEDFSYFANIKPGCMFRLGVANTEKGITSGLHNSHFDIDERSLAIGSDAIFNFIIDNMNGIEF